MSRTGLSGGGGTYLTYITSLSSLSNCLSADTLKSISSSPPSIAVVFLSIFFKRVYLIALLFFLISVWIALF